MATISIPTGTRTNGITPGYINGGKIGRTDLENLTIGPGAAMADDDATVMEWTGTLTLDITTTGAGGHEDGTFTDDTQQYLWVISDSAGGNCAAFMSESASPTLPTGYTKKRGFGEFMYIDVTSKLRKFYTTGTGRLRRVYLTEDTTGASDRRIISTSSGAATWTIVDAGICVPTTAVTYGVQCTTDSKGGGLSLQSEEGSKTAIEDFVTNISGEGTGRQNTSLVVFEVVDNDPRLRYKQGLGSGQVTMRVAWYELEL